MPETTPLLPRSNKQAPHEHPIFLRVCHSPWYFIGQQSLLLLRSLTAIYMTFVIALSIHFEIKHRHNGELYVFNASHISYFMQAVYYWITSLWTLQHLLWPRSREREDRHGFLDHLKGVFTIHKIRDFTPREKLAFSVFYTATTTFPYVVTFLYWFVLEETKGHEFHQHGVGGLVHYNMCGINALMAFIETVVLSSVRKQQPFASHLFFLLIICGLFFAWHAFGHEITGYHVYRQLDPAYNGWRGLVMTYVTVLSLTTAFFLISVGLHDLRNYATAKAACDREIS